MRSLSWLPPANLSGNEVSVMPAMESPDAMGPVGAEALIVPEAITRSSHEERGTDEFDRA